MEAEHRTSQPAGIDVVRNAFGVLADVNQHCPANASTRRVAYQYSLVSTRGFTKHVVAYARTHGIALHDFSGDAWRAVRDTVDLAVEVFRPLLAGAGGQKAVPLSSLRWLLRAALATLQRSHDDGPSAEAAFDHASIERRVRAEAARGLVKGTIAPAQVKSLVPLLVSLAQRHDRSLLIGYPDGQLLLALRPDHTDDLDTLLAKHARTIRGVQVVRVRLAFSPVSVPGELPVGEGGAGDWVVEPEDRSGDFRLRVGLPQGFERTLLTTDDAVATTGERTGGIAIYRHGTPYRLEFALEVRTVSLRTTTSGRPCAASAPRRRWPSPLRRRPRRDVVGERLAAPMLLRPLCRRPLRRVPSVLTGPYPLPHPPPSQRTTTPRGTTTRWPPCWRCSSSGRRQRRGRGGPPTARGHVTRQSRRSGCSTSWRRRGAS